MAFSDGEGRGDPSVDLALLHLGGTRVFGMLVPMDAAQGVRLLQLLHPDLAIPIHYGDYPSSSRRWPTFSARCSAPAGRAR